MSEVPATLLVCGAPRELKQAIHDDNLDAIHSALDKHMPKANGEHPVMRCEGSFNPSLYCTLCPLLLCADATYEPGPLDSVELDQDLDWNHSAMWGKPVTVEAAGD